MLRDTQSQERLSVRYQMALTTKMTHTNNTYLTITTNDSYPRKRSLYWMCNLSRKMVIMIVIIMVIHEMGIVASQIAHQQC
uniref:Uncharacterized protein n=1 Tax=Arundo donax TaxID=35708 RepID=A0A0A9H0Q1_ARUDO